MVSLLVGCGSTARPLANRASDQQSSIPDPRCDVIDVIVTNPRVEKFRCGEAATDGERVVVNVNIEPPLGTCASDAFTQYRDGMRVNRDALLQLSIGQRGSANWRVTASFVDPANSPDDRNARDGGFDDTNYYCHLVLTARGTLDGWRVEDADW